MSKYLFIILGLVVLYAALVTNDLNREKEARLLIESNLSYISKQLKESQEALESREKTIRQIEEDYAEKDKQLEELMEKDNEAKEWLMQTIPISIDNTIPY